LLQVIASRIFKKKFSEPKLGKQMSRKPVPLSKGKNKINKIINKKSFIFVTTSTHPRPSHDVQFFLAIED
jgi:hypothetical protein